MIIDDEDFNESFEKLKGLKISYVYPGHGESFQMEHFMKKELKE
jgi:glyoxylase-like metal-dependent hydrolase (beta-lactamase superfamily II)